MHVSKLIAYICPTKNAEVAQLVELQPSKLVVASSSLVFRSARILNESSGFFYALKCRYCLNKAVV